MARVLLVCELGTGHGHLSRLLPLALALRSRGHEPVFAVSDLSRAEQVLGPHQLMVLPAPQWRNRVDGLPPMRSYTDILLRYGFADVTGLRGLARAWQHLVTLVQPRLMVLDHSPVALFATRAAGVPRLRFGDGFCCPPLRTPMPPFSWWNTSSEAIDTISERNVLHVANHASAEMGLPPVDSVAQMLATSHDFLCTFAELDHYGVRRGATYEGAMPETDSPVTLPPLPWPPGKGPLALVSLQADYPHLEPLLKAIARSPWRAVVHVPGLPSARAQALASERVRFSPLAVPMDQARLRCELAITHGGYAITHALLAGGRPQLLLPRQLEQTMTGQRVREAGMGVVVDTTPAAPDFGALLQSLHDETSWRHAAQAFALRHKDVGGSDTLQSLLRRCEALI